MPNTPASGSSHTEDQRNSIPRSTPWRVGGWLRYAAIPSDPLFVNERLQIAAVLENLRLPAVYGLRQHAEVGGLISYGIDLLGNWRHTADFVDRILKGVTPAELPVELPHKLELVINLKTAKALGLGVPPVLLARADEVIE